jgi:hypothetical protein
MLQRKLKNQGKRLLRHVFEIGQQLGIDVLPRHFYSEIPNIRELRTTTEWREPFSMAGIVGDIPSQVRFVDQCTASVRGKLASLNLLRKACDLNGSDEGFGAVEADFLYCFVRKHRPPKIVQVGCGVSTAVCLMASRDENYRPKIICIEPYPTSFLRNASDSGDIQLVEKKLQNVYRQIADWVSQGDLFFVDSSHTLGPAGEVSRIVLEILPRLPLGVFAHFHDIWFPYDYSPGVLDESLFFWHETALLFAFLCMNQRFRIEASLSLLHHEAQDELRMCIPTYTPAPFVGGINHGRGHYPSSIYLRNGVD